MLAHREQTLSPVALALAEDLRSGRKAGRIEVAGLEIEAIVGRDHLWLRVTGPSQAFALRACSFMAGRGKVRRTRRRKGEALRFTVESLAGMQEVSLRVQEGGVPVLELTCVLTPSRPLSIPFMPRDFYPLGRDGLPGGEGRVEAGQRGMNSALCFVRMDEPGPSTALYWQDLTALNAYFAATASMYGPAKDLTSLAPGTVTAVGGSQAHENMQPFMALNFCIALQGIFPSPT